MRIEPTRYAVVINSGKHEPLRHPGVKPVPDESDTEKRREKKRRHKKPFWRRMVQDVSIIVPAIGVLLISLRLALPYFVRHYVNNTIKHVQEYDGSVQSVRMDLYRGAYKIENLVLVKTNAATREPFLVIPEMDLSIDWSELFHGALVGEVVVYHPRVNFENGPTEQERQVGMHKNWKQTLEKLLPVTINRFQVNDATIHYADPHRDPPVDMRVTHLYAVATNLTNVRNKNTELPAGLIAHGKTTGNGNLNMEMHMNPLAKTPTFKLIAGVTNVDLTALNDFMRAYGNFDVQKGTFALYLDVAAAHEKYQGYFKPFFFDLKVFSWKEAKHQNVLHDFWEAIVAGVSHILRNQPENQLATTVPISGEFKAGTQVDLFATIGGILKNAFIRALVPKVNQPATPLPGGPVTPTGRDQTQSSSPNTTHKSPVYAPKQTPRPAIQ